MNPIDTEFDDIRAYNDHEVSDVLKSLLNNDEFISFIAQQRFPKLSQFLPRWTQKRIHSGLTKKFQKIHSIDDWQQQLAPHVTALLDNTISHLSITGLEHLDKKQTYLFMSNHRDIAMDPLLINYALLKSGHATSKVAIGDNLLGREFVAHIMRLNKSFVVKRSVSGTRGKLVAAQSLSNYIHQCIKQQQHVWIAQREGRAKDNHDETESAVLKMLHLAGRKLGWEFHESMAYLNLIPVSISYEWDPCDIDKAKQLCATKETGEYLKQQDEDFLSIIKGLKGKKGRVSIHFSQPVKLDSNQPKDWCQAIDHEIYKHYEIFANNRQAFKALTEQTPINSNFWHKRFDSLPKPMQQQVLETYAKPLLNQRGLNKHEHTH